jgi:hypothetical protein
MEEQMKTTTLPGGIPAKLMGVFLGRIESKKIPEWDVFGIYTINLLISSLEVANTHTNTWGALAKYVLKKADNRSYYEYNQLLVSLSLYVSLEICERMVEHFARFGEAKNALILTTNKINHFLTPEEVVVMAKYHHKHKTSSESSVWKFLLELADDETKPDIAEMVDEVKEYEDDPELA